MQPFQGSVRAPRPGTCTLPSKPETYHHTAGVYHFSLSPDVRVTPNPEVANQMESQIATEMEAGKMYVQNSDFTGIIGACVPDTLGTLVYRDTTLNLQNSHACS